MEYPDERLLVFLEVKSPTDPEFGLLSLYFEYIYLVVNLCEIGDFELRNYLSSIFGSGAP